MGKLFILLLPLFIFTACKSQPVAEIEIEVEQIVNTVEIIEVAEEEPEIEIEIREPEFNILSIVILQADLVNTQFETVLRIDNPNEFPVSLSSIKYELFGNGAFWASGKGEDVLYIQANDSSETEFRFSMNFIDMNRRLLDDIIAMRQVNYRFSGNAQVEPDYPHVSPFNIAFDCVGVSNVRQRPRS